MNVIVCEDDGVFQKSICMKIESWARRHKVVNLKIKTYDSSDAFLEKWLDGITADLIFLDIMFHSQRTGLEIAEQIRLTNHYVPIVFVSNFDTYVCQGYTVNALRYFIKPISDADVDVCLTVAYKQFVLAHNEYLILTENTQRIIMKYVDILYVEAHSPYVYIYQQDDTKPIKIRCLLSNVQSKLPSEQFVLCHRSYIVNILHIRRLKRTELRLSSGAVLPISRSYLSTLNQVFDEYYQEGGF